jgi:hypothetical protein
MAESDDLLDELRRRLGIQPKQRPQAGPMQPASLDEQWAELQRRRAEEHEFLEAGGYDYSGQGTLRQLFHRLARGMR